MKKTKLLIVLSTLLLLSSCNSINIGINSKTSSSSQETSSMEVSDQEQVSSSEETSSSEQEVVLEDIKLSKDSISIKKGETFLLELVLTPSNAKISSGTWMTGNRKVAVVDEGLVTGVGVGTTLIYFRTGDKELTCAVNVKEDDVTIPVTGISLNANSLNVNKGESVTLNATLTPSNTTEKAIVWSSSDQNIARVVDGVVTGVNEGTCTIYASAGNVKAECVINVKYDEYYKEGYSLLWHDEFDGNSLNSTYWDYDVGGGGWGNSELQYYTNGQNVEVNDGVCNIIAKRERYGSNEFTSSRIVTRGKKHFKYGYFEAKMKLPSFRGAWPAFWMLGKDIYNGNPWPYCGEIDIMEAANDNSTLWGTLHWNGNGKSSSTGYSHQYEGKTTTINNKTEWHTYACEWNEYSISVYLDGQVYFTREIVSKALDCFHEEFYILFNFAVGGQFVGVYDNIGMSDRSTMAIDYVRVYTKN